MSYQNDPLMPVLTILANTGASPAVPQPLPLGYGMNFVAGNLGACSQGGRQTSGDTTVLASDNGTSLVSSDHTSVNLILPTGLPKGFRVRSYQGAAGQIAYIPGVGATIASGSLRSLGDYTVGYFADIENIGSDTWIILNNVVAGINQWQVSGMPSVKEGDACTFSILRPDTTSAYSSVTLNITGTGIDSAGFACTLAQTLQDLANITPSLSFDGVNTLTIGPAAPNPIMLNFFAVPTYTALGNRNATLNISSPSVGSVGTASYTTTVLNVSKPTDPSELFAATVVTVSTDAASGQNQITLVDASHILPYGTVTGNTAIPASTWITAISGNVITINNNLSNILPANAAINVVPAGMWFNFSSDTGLTVDTSTSGSAGYFDISGHLQTASFGTARFDYNPITHASRGLLYEDMSVNLAKQSAFISWSTSNVTLTLNNATSPDNATHAARLTENTASTTHFINGSTSDVGYAVGTTYTVSCYLKAGTETIAQLTFAPNNFAIGQHANFDLSGGLVASSSGVTAAITSVGNGWYRCSITAVCTTASTNAPGYISLTNTNGSASQLPSYTGTSKTLFAYGFQCEAFSTATSYIPTGGSQLIRPAGKLSFTIPAGCTSITVTFDDSSTQIISVSPGAYVLPVATLTLPNINTITGTSLSLDLTGASLPAGTTYTFGNNGLPVSSATDSVNGYMITQSTTNLKPLYVANAWNGLGGLQFNGSSQNLLTSTAQPLFNLLNYINNHYTSFFVLKRVSGTASIGTYGTFMGSCHNTLTYANNIFPAVTQAQANGLAVCFTNWDGTGRINGQAPWTYPMTLTADLPAGTHNVSVDDSTSIPQPVYGAVNPLVCCTVIKSFTAQANPRSQSSTGPTGITVQSAPGVLVPSGTQLYLTGENVSGTVQRAAQSQTSFQIGCTQFNAGVFVVLEFIMINRMLTPQQLNGIHLYIANKWGTSFTTTASASVAPSTNPFIGPAWRVPISSTTNICPGQVITAIDGIAAGTVIKGINSGVPNIEIDTPIQSPGITNGATITVTTPAFKTPAYLDVNQFDLIYRDDFQEGFRKWNGSNGWTVNQGSYWNFPFNNSVQGGINFDAFYPDPTYPPWVPYNPFSVINPAGAETGALQIDEFATPTPIARALAAIGVTKKMVGALPTNQQEFRFMHGYVEARIKMPKVKGAWNSFWITAANDEPIYGVEWPPEFDIYESFDGLNYGSTSPGIFSSNTFTSDGNNPYSISTGAVAWGPTFDEFVIVGAELTPTHIDLYRNREFIRRVPTAYDTTTFWCMNMETDYNGFWDGSSHLPIVYDYVAAWRRKPQTPTVPSSTQAETTALLAAMSVQPSSERQTLINTLIASLKTYKTAAGQSFWSALDFLFIPAAHDDQAGRINWKNPAPVANKAGSVTFQTDRGFTGNFGSAYCDTGLALATAGFQLTQSQHHIGAVINNVNGAPQSTSTGTVGSSQYFLQPTNTAQFITRNLAATNDWQGNIYNSIIQLGLGPNTVPPGTTAANCHLLTTRNYYKMFPYVNGQYASGMSTGTPGQGNKTHSNPQPALDTDNMLFANSNYQTACFHGGAFLTADDARDLYTLLYNYLHALGAL